MSADIICNNKYDKENFKNRIKGMVLVSADKFTGEDRVVSESLLEVKIKENMLYNKICNYAFNNGLHYQELFQDSKYIYMTCFIYDASDFRKIFAEEELLKSVLESKADHFSISFPKTKVSNK